MSWNAFGEDEFSERVYFAQDPLEQLILGKSTKEKVQIRNSYLAYKRLEHQKDKLSKQVSPQHLDEIKIKLPTNRYSKYNEKHLQSRKVILPRAIRSFLGKGNNDPKYYPKTDSLEPIQSSFGSSIDQAEDRSSSFSAVQNLKSLSPSSRPNKKRFFSSLKKSESLSSEIPRVAPTIKEVSPSERIGLLLCPFSNVRTYHRNSWMRNYTRTAIESSDISSNRIRALQSLSHRADDSLVKKEEVKPISNALPLEYFDDLSYETRTPEEWIALGKYSGGTRGYSFYNDATNMKSCIVLEYDDLYNRYKIEWNDGTGACKWVARLSLRFEDECEEAWNRRVAEIKELRELTEKSIRLEMYLKAMDNNQVIPLGDEEINRILFLASKDFPLHLLDVIDDDIEDIRSFYVMSIKRAIHRYRYLDPAEKKRLLPLQLLDIPPASLPSLFSLQYSAAPPSDSFIASREFISENLFQISEVIRPPLVILNRLWLNVRHTLLVDTTLQNFELPCKLSLLLERQAKHGHQMAQYLYDHWNSAISTTIQSSLDGHFEFYEDNIERFKQHRASRLIQLLNITLSSQVRQILTQSMDAYLLFLKTYEMPESLKSALIQGNDLCWELDEDIQERAYWTEVEKRLLADKENQKMMRLETELAQQQRQRRRANDIEGAFETVVFSGEEEKEMDTLPPSNPDADASPDESVLELASPVQKITQKPVSAKPNPSSILEFPFFQNKILFHMPMIHIMRNSSNGCPLFSLELVNSENQVDFSPSMDQVMIAVQTILINIFQYGYILQGIGPELFPLLSLPEVDIQDFTPSDPLVINARSWIEELVEENLVGLYELRQMYQMFEYLFQVDTEKLVQSFFIRKPPPTLEYYDITLERLKRDSERIRMRTLDEVNFSLFRINCGGIKQSLINAASHISRSLMDLLTEQMREQCEDILRQYKKIVLQLSSDPQTPEELQELKNYIDIAPSLLEELRSRFSVALGTNDLLVKYSYTLGEYDFLLFWEVQEWPKNVQQKLDDCEFSCKEYRATFQRELRDSCERITEMVNHLSAVTDEFAHLGDLSQADNRYERARELDAQIKQCDDTIALCNSHEVLFGLPTTQWPLFKEIRSFFLPYLQLWDIASSFTTSKEHWFGNRISSLNPSQIDNQVQEWLKRLSIIAKKIKDDAPSEVLREIRSNLESFSTNIPLIYALRSNLQVSHWRSIFQVCGIEGHKQLDIATVDSKSLGDYLKMNMMDHIHQIESIATVAARTIELENELTAMENDWKKIVFELEQVLDTYKIKTNELMQQTLDEHILRTLSILSKPILRLAPNVQLRATVWAKLLDNVRVTLEEWYKCQATWSYLEPIFSSADICQGMPNEKIFFTNVDDIWHKIMEQTRMTPQVLARCKDETLLHSFTECNEILDQVLRKLHQFLDVKRMVFPRFYFISNEELLQILSDTKDPFLVQPYLAKCFEGIKHVHFEENLDICAMESPQGEVVPFVRPVNPATYDNIVEKWLLAVETVMKESIRDQLRLAYGSYLDRSRTEFIRFWPGQIVIAICSVFWTMEATEAMTAEGQLGLKVFHRKCSIQLDDLIILVRDKGLKSIERCTLEALVVIEVHAKDVIAELVDKAVENPQAFDWIAQLRYYWTEDEHLYAHQISAARQYAYEYLGNSGRLVITPLTDRCYRTLLGALYLNYGGAPEGPAGTGKTETTKDLAKALGNYCVVYNCSDQITSKDMAKLFKGLVQAGAWGCFDEFNRIEVQVLSVIAQQVATIQEAILLHCNEFIFEGAQIPLNPGCAIFITMNPGYAGRAELPDNLKALFRPVAMMVPNYALIGEIQLYSHGFLHGRTLAEKIVATYRLCSEQLSSQDHYDYGMRAVKAVLSAAGNLKREFPDEDEAVLMLRSIQDVNLPKFLSQDIELFLGITADLFPGVVLPPSEYSHMQRALSEVCLQMNLKRTPYFCQKIFQVYEMIIVRHGLMVVGMSFGGKTSILRVLSRTLTLLEHDNLERRTHLITLNPKSITLTQLYGQVDLSGEWIEGVLSKNFRLASSNSGMDRIWIILDGPVDAVWIESMNTVLDDNKKLCLQNGDIIPLSPWMNMIFEVQDLVYASPATVSRCGMIYVEPDALGWKCLVDSYFQTLPEFITDNKDSMDCLNGLIDIFIPYMLNFVRKETICIIPQGSSVAVSGFLKLFDSFFQEFEQSMLKSSTEGNKTDDAVPVNLAEPIDPYVLRCRLEGWFFISLAWSLGGCLYTSDRARFHQALMGRVGELTTDNTTSFRLAVTMPESNYTIFDVFFNPKSPDPHFESWKEILPDFSASSDVECQDIIVPTTETVRLRFLVDKLVSSSYPCLLVGDTGTGKSVLLKSYLQQLSWDRFLVNFVQFSARTSANIIQTYIDKQCERRRKNVYGPPIGKKMIFFIDDVNLPQIEEYGSQPPIELLRQFLGHHGWYQHIKGDVSFRTILDLLLLGAMGPPGGGRNPLTERFTRHFNTLAVPPCDEETLNKIFGTIMTWILRQGFQTSLHSVGPSLVSATIHLYSLLSEKIKPTPEKSHYIFNMRDVGKVFQGIAIANSAKITDENQLYLLWFHEFSRVFVDRFIDQSGLDWFRKEADDVMREYFRVNLDSLLQNNSSLLFTTFMNVEGSYERVKNIPDAFHILERKLDEYNATARKGTLNLVIFQYVLEHVCRICRILKLPGGNALLIGVGGSGRESCSKLASFVLDYEYCTTTLSREYKRSDFHGEIRALLLKAGKLGFPVVFSLNDSQITDESFLEDISSLLNSGEVPGLWDGKQEHEVYNHAVASLRDVAKDLGRGDSVHTLQALFVERCRKNLHIILQFSPLGKSLRERLRKFPPLVNCTTIDWLREWPRDALRNAALRSLESVDVSDDMKSVLPDIFVTYHEQVSEISITYFKEARQQVYATPTSYMQLLSVFTSLFKNKRNELTALKLRYENGLAQLQRTEDSVEGMQQELVLLGPELEQKKGVTQELIFKVEAESRLAEEARAIIAADEEMASKQAMAAKKIHSESQAKIDEAQPLVERAEKAVQDLDLKALQEIKALKKPPLGVKYVIEVLCTLLGGIYIPKSFRDPITGKNVTPYWEHSKSCLLTGDFKNILLVSYPGIVDGAPEERIHEVKKKMSNDMFKTENIRKTSVALLGVATYIRSVVEYYKQNKIIKPLQAQASATEEEYNNAMGALNLKKEELHQLTERLEERMEELNRVREDHQALEDKVNDTHLKLTRAKQLIDGLGGEKARYIEEAKKYGKALEYLLGGVTLSAGIIVYMGPFLNKYRRQLLGKWIQLCKEKGISIDPEFSFERFIGNPNQIQQWRLAQLPTDIFSVDNAIIISNSSRWPLIIDPQQQANRWIRNMERPHGLVIVRDKDPQCIRYIADAVRSGAPCLMEDVSEELDPMLRNLLSKSIVREGTIMTIELKDIVEYNQNFRFYMTSKIPRPNYRPEVTTKVTLINFMITEEGLQDQLLQQVIYCERPEVEERKNAMTIEAATNKAQLKATEDTILAILSSEGNILESETAIEELGNSKDQSDRVAKRQDEIDAMARISNKTRNQFVPAAHLGAMLFFCITDLATVDPMYQYSLSFFIYIFQMALRNSQRSSDVEERLKSIENEFLILLYRNICRSLFSKDHLLLTFLMSLRIFYSKETLTTRWLMMGGFDRDKDITPNPLPEWLPDLNWKILWRASVQLSAFSSLPTLLKKYESFFRRFYESLDIFDMEFPEELQWIKDLNFLILVRCLRIDKMVSAVTNFVQKCLGPQFIESVLVNLEEIVEEQSSDPTVPIIFVLSPGADPNAELDKLAEIYGMTGSRLQKISLGQGQNVLSCELIAEGIRSGNWVLLQNCHLYRDFMPELGRIIEDYSREDLKDSIHRDYRLWLTSSPSEDFPVTLLQNSVKLVQEPPKGLKSNLLRSYTSDPIASSSFFDSTDKPAVMHKLIFSLSMFHAVVQERRHFGPLGWNKPYEFNDTDMHISLRQLQLFLSGYPEIPFEALQYLTGQCNYGGRVTDDWDRRTLNAILNRFYIPEALEDEYVYAPELPEFLFPSEGPYENYIDFIMSLSLDRMPGLFGLNANALATKEEFEARLLLDTALSATPQEYTGNHEGNAIIMPKNIVLQAVHDILSSLRPPFDIEMVAAKYPINRAQSMNTVFQQELIRYNRLIIIVRDSLTELQRAIQGEVLMSAELERIFNSIYDAKVPDLWRRRSYPSLKPLGSYIEDFLKRLKFFDQWIQEGPPSTFWISGFFFTQSFFTGIMQNFSRKFVIEIDKLQWKFDVLDHIKDNNINAPDDGCIIYGLYLEAAGWDSLRHCLCESKPKELFMPFPLLQLTPVIISSSGQRDNVGIEHEDMYECPIYKTTERRGVLSTTGHSTNFIMPILLNSGSHISPSHWVLRGVALFTQLSY